MSKEEIKLQTAVLDHHGLVAAQCIDVQLAERIDQCLGDTGKRIVSYGRATMAMIINGLGFAHRRLYLTPQFFESKSVATLLGEGIEARHLHDDTLGDTLDAIAKYGAEKLYAKVAFGIAVEHQLLGGLTHLDTTSFVMHGDYVQSDSLVSSENAGSTLVESSNDSVVEAFPQPAIPETINVTYGHSKDHRPDLKQVVLSLSVVGGSGVPIWMTPCDGNASDKLVLGQTIERIEAFRREINCTDSSRYVADSALFTADNLRKMTDVLWVSRVPENIVEAKALITKPTADITWTAQENGYKTSSFDVEYAAIQQRWLLVYSQQAYEREEKTLQKNLDKKEGAAILALRKFGHELFACEKDAEKAFKKQQKAHPLFSLTSTLEPILKYARAGRHKADEKKQCVGYRVRTTFTRNEVAITALLHTKGRFILATNDQDKDAYPDTRLLAEYKEQQTVERGFRFLKNPEFMADTFFIKSPKRIEALMMVMTLCLMIYNLAQHKLRHTLETIKETLPNQLGKPTKTPTLRWIFQLMEGITYGHIFDHTGKLIHQLVSSLSALQTKIIRLFGKTACLIYGVG